MPAVPTRDRRVNLQQESPACRAGPVVAAAVAGLGAAALED
jgi:hypothetical protein